MASSRRDRAWRWLERLFALTAVTMFAVVGFGLVRAEMDWRFASQVLHDARTPPGSDTVVARHDESQLVAPLLPAGDDESPGPAPVLSRAPIERAFVGVLEIPRVNLSTLVYDVRDPAAMRHAAGHLRGTPLPWQPGNSAVAGHRDSAFRELRHVRPGDDIRLITPHGTFNYRVTRAFVVYPEEVSVLDTKAAALTLITCFPFRWVGTAPERWIVQAARAPS